MAEMIISTGTPDSQLYLQAVANVAAPYEVTPSSGNTPSLVNNILVNRRLSNMWLMVNLTSRAFVDGLGVTSVGAEGENVGMIRFPLLYMPPRIKRTLGINGCGSSENGTPGNNAPFNKNLPHSVQTDAYDMKFNQEYDEAAQISRVNMRMIGDSLDLLGQYTSYIPMTTGLMMDADVIASQVGTALTRAGSANAGIIAYDPNNTGRGYMQRVMNRLKSALSNIRGSYAEGVISYPTEKSVYVMRQSFFDNLMTIDNGAIINSDIGQEILLNGYLDKSGERLMGNYIQGIYSGIYIKVIPDEIWDTAAATLGLTAEQYTQWNKVQAYIANAEGTMFGMSATVTDVDKSPTTSIGYIIRNDWGWGVKVVRPSSIALVVESEVGDLSDFTNPVTSFTDINSPANMEGMIAEYQDALNAPVSSVQRAVITAPAFVCDVTLTVTGIADAEVVVRGEGGVYASVINNGDNTYAFTLPRASAAVVTIAKDGYETSVLDITVANTATATYAVTQVLTEA